jgi:hypothetical protein
MKKRRSELARHCKSIATIESILDLGAVTAIKKSTASSFTNNLVVIKKSTKSIIIPNDLPYFGMTVVSHDGDTADQVNHIVLTRFPVPRSNF